jgi:hypothetical protein
MQSAGMDARLRGHDDGVLGKRAVTADTDGPPPDPPTSSSRSGQGRLEEQRARPLGKPHYPHHS